MLFFNPSASWACAPRLVRKPPRSMCRLTVDHCQASRSTVKHDLFMPSLEHELSKLAKSKYFAILDLSNKYWQTALSKEWQECQLLVALDVVYTSTHVLHGTTDAVMYLQSTLAVLLPPSLREHILLCLDDNLIHSPAVKARYVAVSYTFFYCASYNFQIHPDRRTLFATTIRWCRRIIPTDGIVINPLGIRGTRNMNVPIIGADVQQFVCSMQWMRAELLKFSTLIRPLADILESV